MLSPLVDGVGVRFPAAPFFLFLYVSLVMLYILGFGHIITAAYASDKYGVVQRDFGTVIGNLLDLYALSDRFGRLITSQRIDRCQKQENDSRLAMLRDQLTKTMQEILAVFGTLR